MVSEWESDKLLIRQPNAIAIEHLFGISWRWLLYGEGEMWASELPAWITQRLQAQGQAVPTPQPPPPKKAQKSQALASSAPSTPAPALPTEGLVQVAQNLAIAQCQAAGTAGDPVKIVAAFKAILGSLQS